MTRGYLGWGYFGLGLFWHGVILVWGYFGLGLLWFGVIMVWGYFGGVISVGLFWFGVISYCSQRLRVKTKSGSGYYYKKSRK